MHVLLQLLGLPAQAFFLIQQHSYPLSISPALRPLPGSLAACCYNKVLLFCRIYEAEPQLLGPAAALLPVLGWASADHSCPRSGTIKDSVL